MTEAQAALDRSIKDFVKEAQSVNPELNPEFSSPVSSVVPQSTPEGLPSDAVEKSPSVAPAKSSDSKIQENGTKKEKKQRDPALPKRPASAFFLFQNAIRNSVKSAMPEEAKGIEIQQAVSAKWKALDDKARKPYDDQHEKEMLEYEAQMAAYNKENGIKPRTKPSAKQQDKQESTVKGSRQAPTQANDDDAAAASLVQAGSLVDGSNSSKKRSHKSDAENPKKVKTPKKSAKGTDSEEKKWVARLC